MKVSVQLLSPAVLPLEKKPPGTYWIGDWVVPVTGLDPWRREKFTAPAVIILTSVKSKYGAQRLQCSCVSEMVASERSKLYCHRIKAGPQLCLTSIICSAVHHSTCHHVTV